MQAETCFLENKPCQHTHQLLPLQPLQVCLTAGPHWELEAERAVRQSLSLSLSLSFSYIHTQFAQHSLWQDRAETSPGLQCRAQAVLPTKPQPACLRLPGLWLDEHGGLLDQQQRLWGRSVPPGFLQGTICKGMGGPMPSACRSWQASDWGSQGRAERGVSGGWARQKPRRQGAGLGLAWTRPHTATSRSRPSLPPTSAVTLPSLLTVAAVG